MTPDTKTGIGTAAAAGGGFLASLLMPGTGSLDKKIGANIDLLSQMGVKNQQQGQALVGSGHDALMPVLTYLTKVASGNPVDVLQATTPERNRVIDQYDAARKSIAMNTQRGGGVSSVINQSRFDQASTLSNITSQARREGVNQLGQVGTALTGLGLTAEQIASGDIGAVIEAYMKQSAQKKEESGGFGQAIGNIIGTVLPFIL